MGGADSSRIFSHTIRTQEGQAAKGGKQECTTSPQEYTINPQQYPTPHKYTYMYVPL